MFTVRCAIWIGVYTVELCKLTCDNQWSLSSASTVIFSAAPIFRSVHYYYLTLHYSTCTSKCYKYHLTSWVTRTITFLGQSGNIIIWSISQALRRFARALRRANRGAERFRAPTVSSSSAKRCRPRQLNQISREPTQIHANRLRSTPTESDPSTDRSEWFRAPLK